MKRKINISPMLMIIILLVISRLVRGGMSDPVGWITDHLIMLPAILTGLSLHEFGHAFVSDRLGDPTPRNQGRVTINPMAHVDPIGLLCLLFAGFGWGIPVQINPGYYKHRRRDEALTAVAGVTMNLLLALIATVILRFIISISNSDFLYSTAGEVIGEMLQYMISINIVLMVFNLLPIPPLDGFNLVTQIFNLGKYQWYSTLYNNGSIILLILILFGGTSLILSPAVNFIYGLMLKLLTI